MNKENESNKNSNSKKEIGKRLSTGTIKTYIDGGWSTKEFEKLFNIYKNLRDYSEFEIKLSIFPEIYNANFKKDMTERDKMKIFERHMDIWFGNRSEKKAIGVLSIQYSSPGWVELLFGSAAVVAGIVALIKHYIPNKKEVLDIRYKQVELLEKKITMLEKLGYKRQNIIKHLDVPINGLFKALKEMNKMTLDDNIKKIESKPKN
ncbi:hypothetical protein [Aquimarina algiphila]|uniref:hypothetical protein n=1 Tax=Aquimarina algiphila TaxID=2047982 RepID=UPI0023310452|nr:hypothetical protein [Aquimarina algiphila]